MQTYCIPNFYHLQKQYHLGKWLTVYSIRNSYTNITLFPSLQEIYIANKEIQQYCMPTREETYSITPNYFRIHLHYSYRRHYNHHQRKRLPMYITKTLFFLSILNSKISQRLHRYYARMKTSSHSKKVYTAYLNSSVTELDTKRTLLITTDGTNTNIQSGGGWIITTTTGNLTAHGGNPIIGNTQSINSHQAQIYVTSALFIFLHKYCKYYQIRNDTVNILYCDDEKVVKKLKTIIKKGHTSMNTEYLNTKQTLP